MGGVLKGGGVRFLSLAGQLKMGYVEDELCVPNDKMRKTLLTPGGLEPSTFGFEDQCSTIEPGGPIQ